MSKTTTNETEETTTEVPQEAQEQPNGTEEAQDATETENEAQSGEHDTFPRDYVEKLRDENAKHRQRAKESGERADTLAQRLHTALVERTGRLQDASDLPFDEKYLDDPESLTGAIDALLAAKPHLAARKLSGNVGQGASSPSSTVDLAGLLRSRA